MNENPEIDRDAILCALVLAPNTFARNRFFGMFERPDLKRVRKRAKRVRGIIRQLTGNGREQAEIVGEQVFDARVLIRFQVKHLSYQQTTSLSPLEAALVHYALHQARGAELNPSDRACVETTLLRLSQQLTLSNGDPAPETTNSEREE